MEETHRRVREPPRDLWTCCPRQRGAKKLCGSTNLLSRSSNARRFGSIMNQKLDTLRWCLLHSGLNVARIQDDDGHTGMQNAAAMNKVKSMKTILECLQRRRELREAIDVADDDGRTPLMMAAHNGHVQIVELLVEFGANVTRKDARGRTARDYAVAARKSRVIEFFDSPDDDDDVDDGPTEAELSDGGFEGETSTQRNKRKRREKEALERRGLDADDDGSAGGAAGGAGGAIAEEEKGEEESEPAPEPVWEEVATVVTEDRRELTVERAEDSVAEGESFVVDPALWHLKLVNHLALRVPPGSLAGGCLPSDLGRMTSLATLILSGNGMTALPDVFESLPLLKNVELENNRLAELPASMGALTSLEMLNLSHNALTSVAPISTCTNLVTLLLDYQHADAGTGAGESKDDGDDSDADEAPSSPLTALEIDFSGMKRLSTLSASGCALASLPPSIGSLEQLAFLKLNDNALTSLPAELAGLNAKKLKTLEL